MAAEGVEGKNSMTSNFEKTHVCHETRRGENLPSSPLEKG